MGFISDLQAIGKVLQKAGNVKLYESLLRIQAEALELMERYRSLKEENNTLKEKLKIKGSIVFEKEAYWIKDKNGNVKDEPLCPNCYDAGDLTVHLTTYDDDPRYKRCPNCGHFRKNS